MAFVQAKEQTQMIYEINNLTFTYPGTERRVLDRASLSLKKGEILCILGPNGAGKTTLLNCMAGLLASQEGEIRLCGRDIRQMSGKETAALVGYVPQVHTPAFDYTVADFVLMGSAPRVGMFAKPGETETIRAKEAMKQMGILHLADRSYMEISGGERQQALIARAIVQEPEVILFDEPTAHLDYGNQHRVLKMIKEMSRQGFSIVITTHNPDHALLLDDHAAIVKKTGTIISGKSSEIITEKTLCEVYGIDLKLIYVEQLHRTTCLAPGI